MSLALQASTLTAVDSRFIALLRISWRTQRERSLNSTVSRGQDSWKWYPVALNMTLFSHLLYNNNRWLPLKTSVIYLFWCVVYYEIKYKISSENKIYVVGMAQVLNSHSVSVADFILNHLLLGDLCPAKGRIMDCWW